jgi:hypothetical protein
MKSPPSRTKLLALAARLIERSVKPGWSAKRIIRNIRTVFLFLEKLAHPSDPPLPRFGDLEETVKDIERAFRAGRSKNKKVGPKLIEFLRREYPKQ